MVADSTSQETLFVVSERSGQIYTPVSHETDVAAVDVVEQKLHLINTLGYLAGASMRSGLVRAGQDVLNDRYGDEASKVVTGAENQRVILIKKAKHSFARATGHFTLVDSGLTTETDARRLTTAMFSDFLKKYYGPRHHEALHDYRLQLESEVDSLIASHDSESSISMFNRQNGVRNHRSDNSVHVIVDYGEELEELGTRGRLEAILGDPRAGFIPTTNNEKNQIVSWLDYLDDPEKPLGIINQLREVFVRAQRPSKKGRSLGVKYGVRAVESIAWEVGDYLQSASLDLANLQSLRTSVDQDQRPTLSLYDDLHKSGSDEQGDSPEELFGQDTNGLLTYIQWLDIKEFMEKGNWPGPVASPIVGTEDPPRSLRPKFDSSPGKRKTIFDQYHRPDITEEFKAHIISRAKTITFRDIRSNIDDCISNSERRLDFHNRRFTELAEYDDGPSSPVREAVNTIQEKLKSTDAVA